MWTVRRRAEIRQKGDSILEIENRFRSTGMGASEIAYIDLYSNQWVLVNQIEDSVRC